MTVQNQGASAILNGTNFCDQTPGHRLFQLVSLRAWQFSKNCQALFWDKSLSVGMFRMIRNGAVLVKVTKLV